jgi:transaldolase
VVRPLARILATLGSDTRILAASVKSVGQALSAIEDGAHAVSLPLAVIESLAVHPMTEEAIEAFRASFPEGGA